MKHILALITLLFAAATSCHALPSDIFTEVETRAEAQITASSGSFTPLWLNANKQGLSSLNLTNGYVRAGAFLPMRADSVAHFGLAAGADIVGAGGFTSKFVAQQLYADLRWHHIWLTLGSKEQPMALKNQELSSGSQTLGINARPVPGVRLELPEWWALPFTKGWVQVKGHIFYGWTTDDNWQQDFTARQSKHTVDALLHTKAGYLRVGRKGCPLSVELGLEMGAQFGGTSYLSNSTGGLDAVKNKGGISGMLDAFIPGGSDAVEGTYKNVDGNHVGSYLARINYDTKAWRLSVYADHYFEDHSQMFFFTHNGYGDGTDAYDRLEQGRPAADPDWDVKKRHNYFVFDLKDALLGIELQLKQGRWINSIVGEYIYTKYQSGPMYHDHTQTLPTQLAGKDDYYNHYVFNGWQHWGQVMGNPLYRSPLYNTNGLIEVLDNRFWAWHFGISGNPFAGFHYRMLATWQKGFGTYSKPLPNPETNRSFLIEGRYAFDCRTALRGWYAAAALGIDHGGLLGNNTGVQITIGRRLTYHLTAKK